MQPGLRSIHECGAGSGSGLAALAQGLAQNDGQNILSRWIEDNVEHMRGGPVRCDHYNREWDHGRRHICRMSRWQSILIAHVHLQVRVWILHGIPEYTQF